MLQELLENLSESAVYPVDARHEWPTLDDREAWEGLRESLRHGSYVSAILQSAERIREEPLTEVPWSRAMDFGRTGDRDTFQGPAFDRQRRLSTLVLAEAIENEGRFVERVIDYIGELCGEPTWTWPAHYRLGPGECLPSWEREHVDLGSGRVADLLATTVWLLREPLAGYSPQIEALVRKLIEERTFREVEQHHDHAFQKLTNNWAPWVAASVLAAANRLIEDKGRWLRLAHNLAGEVDRFLAEYGADGACDEGPGYWNRAAASMLDFVEHLGTGCAVDLRGFYADPRTRAMGRYLPKVHLGKGRFANFADSSMDMHPRLASIWRYGERFAVPEMQGLVAELWEGEELWLRDCTVERDSMMVVGDFMRWLWWLPGDFPEVRAVAAEAVSWFPSRQVLVTRVSEGRFTVAVKGGDNGESHNHNDLGHVIVFADEEPVIIDLGRGTYTRQTFSPRRYELYFTRGIAHNGPCFGQVEQQAGIEYCSEVVAYEATEVRVRLQLNLARAYPVEANLAELTRSLEIDLGIGSLTVEDRFSFLGEASGDYRVTLLSPHEPKLLEGKWILGDSGVGLVAEGLEVSVDRLELEDGSLRKSWGDGVWRISLQGEAETGMARWSVERLEG